MWAVQLASEHSLLSLINAEVIGLLCAPFLRSNQHLVRLIVRYNLTARGSTPLVPSHINLARLRSGRCDRWSQVFVSGTRSLSPERPLDNLAAVLVAGLLAPPHTPLELRMDLTGLRAVSGAALAYAEARSGRRFIRPLQDAESTPADTVPALSPTSLARLALLAARTAHRSPWGSGPNAARTADGDDNLPSIGYGGNLRPLLATMSGVGSHPEQRNFGGPSPLALPGLVECQIAAWVVRQWREENHADGHAPVARWHEATQNISLGPDMPLDLDRTARILETVSS